jgi:putative ABC transport system ATP-binding protein
MIDLLNVGKVYEGKEQPVVALAEITMRVDAGEFVVIVGPSGSGKSTLLQIIGCLESPTSGHYVFDGRAVERFDDAELSRVRNERIGFVFQSFNLIARTTALENVETPLLYSSKAVAPDRAMGALEQVGMAHRANHFPGELSGGEQQRVAIARALVMGPSLLIADEPTGNLDSTTGEHILTLLRSLHRAGLTMILVTHDESLARHADRVLTLRDGRLVRSGRTTTLATAGGAA